MTTPPPAIGYTSTGLHERHDSQKGKQVKLMIIVLGAKPEDSSALRISLKPDHGCDRDLVSINLGRRLRCRMGTVLGRVNLARQGGGTMRVLCDRSADLDYPMGGQ